MLLWSCIRLTLLLGVVAAADNALLALRDACLTAATSTAKAYAWVDDACFAMMVPSTPKNAEFVFKYNYCPNVLGYSHYLPLTDAQRLLMEVRVAAIYNRATADLIFANTPSPTITDWVVGAQRSELDATNLAANFYWGRNATTDPSMDPAIVDWASGQPNNWGNDNDCMSWVIDSWTPSNAGLNDYPCASKLNGYVCEIRSL